jgi:hypothetical protein
MSSLDLASDCSRIDEAIILSVPNKISNTDMLAAERHFDKRAHSLGCHISQKIIGGSTADIVEILISSSPNHKLKESSILVWKVFVDNVEKTIPRFIV